MSEETYKATMKEHKSIMEKQTDIRKEYFDLGEKQGRNQAISEFKEKLKDNLFYGDYLHFNNAEKKVISNVLNKTAQELTK